MKRCVGIHGVVRKRLAIAVAGCFCLGPVLANPAGPQVASGSAAFSAQGRTLTISNSPGAIINWQGFSIGAGETTRFNQASAASSVLNRVVGSDPSQLLGQLQSNGRVFLINPAGILVGAGAVVDTAGFVASTLNLANADFLAGRLNFTATPGAGKVQNAGTITTPGGGSVYLVGAQVENRGLITAPNGEVLLAAGKTAQLVDTATPGVRVEITADQEQALNLGQILAASGRVGMVGAIVRNSGRISASSVSGEGGRVFLRASADAFVEQGGTIEATGTRGGRVEVLGNRVALTDRASIDVSGTQGGGTILAGGDYQGGNAGVPNATITYVGDQVLLKADAVEQGNGGKVIVWADDITRFYGAVTARGGSRSGDGGLVEVSGKRYLDFQGTVSTTAAHGRSGTLLLDPTDITISNDVTETDILGTSPFEGSGGRSNLNVDVLKTALESGNVIVDASAPAAENNALARSLSASSGEVLGNITVADDVAWCAGNSLTLKTSAGGGIAINAKVSAGSGALLLDAGSGGITSTAAGIVSGRLQVTAAGDVSLTASNRVSVLSASVTDGAFELVNGAALTVDGLSAYGDIALRNHAALTAVGAVSSAAGSVALSAQGPLRVAADASVSASSNELRNTLTLTAGSPASALASDVVTIDGPLSAAGAITLAGHRVAGSHVPSGAILEVYHAAPVPAPTPTLAPTPPASIPVPAPDLSMPAADGSLLASRGQVVSGLQSAQSPASPPAQFVASPVAFSPPAHSPGVAVPAAWPTFGGGMVGGEAPDTFGAPAAAGSGAAAAAPEKNDEGKNDKRKLGQCMA